MRPAAAALAAALLLALPDPALAQQAAAPAAPAPAKPAPATPAKPAAPGKIDAAGQPEKLPPLLAMPSSVVLQSLPPPTDPARKDIVAPPIAQIPNYRAMMRDIVGELSTYARGRQPGFIVLARNGLDLLAKGEREAKWEALRDPEGKTADQRSPRGTPERPYLLALDGVLVDGLFCGREKSDAAGPADQQGLLLAATGLLRAQGRRVLSLDYCTKGKLPGEAAKAAAKAKVLSMDTADRRLATIPATAPPAENAEHINALSDVRNFLAVLDAGQASSREAWVASLGRTNHDLLFVDVLFRGREPLTKAEVQSLKYKRLGARRLVIAVLPIGVAADYRFYWQHGWTAGHPDWLAAPDPRDQALTLVRYWEPPWKEILGKYMAGIMDLGFDGVLFDEIETFQHFEALAPLE